MAGAAAPRWPLTFRAIYGGGDGLIHEEEVTVPRPAAPRSERTSRPTGRTWPNTDDGWEEAVTAITIHNRSLY